MFSIDFRAISTASAIAVALVSVAAPSEAAMFSFSDNVSIQPSDGSVLSPGSITGSSTGSVGIRLFQEAGDPDSLFLSWAADFLHDGVAASLESTSPVEVMFNGSGISQLIQIPTKFNLSAGFTPGNYETSLNLTAVLRSGSSPNSAIVGFDSFQESTDWEVIPTPALLPGLVGLGVAALRRKQSGTAQENEG
jgi:hypothetical protein